MSYREKENIINIFSGLVITAIYAWFVYQRHLEGRIDLVDDFQAWGKLFLVYAGISVVARIIIYIVFHIINAIVTHNTEATHNGEIPPEDERDKLIKLKALRNSHYSFVVGFMLAIIALAIGLPTYSIFIVFVISGVISELIDNGSQIYYYRKGV
ncbi:hypothetical protein GM418_28540 [Maribellus comscasis]|uniref:Uncharacterized protein n=1 Tax=Maribellus comscasis TaxID=2681766 RepID=A0A6I6JWG8_9BACT|nr:hypothetical protein [Maribellus comscasis]QGY47476.1 hypothetical protein GM418_28540 [Maribellus comscasis]